MLPRASMPSTSLPGNPPAYIWRTGSVRFDRQRADHHASGCPPSTADSSFAARHRRVRRVSMRGQPIMLIAARSHTPSQLLRWSRSTRCVALGRRSVWPSRRDSRQHDPRKPPAPALACISPLSRNGRAADRQAQQRRRRSELQFVLYRYRIRIAAQQLAHAFSAPPDEAVAAGAVTQRSSKVRYRPAAHWLSRRHILKCPSGQAGRPAIHTAAR